MTAADCREQRQHVINAELAPTLSSNMALSGIQNDDFGLGVAHALHDKLVSGIDSLNKGAVSLSKHAPLILLPAVQPDPGSPALGHGQMHVDLPPGRVGRVGAHRVLEAAARRDDAGRHDEVGVDGDGARDHGLGGALLRGCRVDAAPERAQQRDEAPALVVVGEAGPVVPRCQPALPGDDPDLQKVHRLLAVVVELGVRDTRAGRRELDVAPPDPAEEVGLLLFSLFTAAAAAVLRPLMLLC